MIFTLLSQNLSSRFTHFFRKYFETEKQAQQTFLFLDVCMMDSGFTKEQHSWTMFFCADTRRHLNQFESIRKVGRERLTFKVGNPTNLKSNSLEC